MSERGSSPSFVRTALYAIGIAGLAVLLVRWSHHRNAAGDAPALDQSSPPAAASQPPQPARPTQVSAIRILAGCQPHLSQNSESVPNFDVDSRPNPAALQLKVRFWVNGDGFVIHPFMMGANAVRAPDQEAALDYVRHLTFSVPNTEECRVREMEMFGTFLEARESLGEWSTVFEVHPRYSMSGDQVVQNR